MEGRAGSSELRPFLHRVAKSGIIGGECSGLPTQGIGIVRADKMDFPPLSCLSHFMLKYAKRSYLFQLKIEFGDRDRRPHWRGPPSFKIYRRLEFLGKLCIV